MVECIENAAAVLLETTKVLRLFKFFIFLSHLHFEAAEAKLLQFNHLQDLQNLENLASKVDAVVSLLWIKVLPLNFSFLTLNDAEAMP